MPFRNGSEQYETRESEADAFAATLLMPKREVLDHWNAMYGESRISLSELMPRRAVILNNEIVRRRFVPRTSLEAKNMLLDGAVGEFAELFCVSPMAMRIRCEQLGLVTRR